MNVNLMSKYLPLVFINLNRKIIKYSGRNIVFVLVVHSVILRKNCYKLMIFMRGAENHFRRKCNEVWIIRSG